MRRENFQGMMIDTSGKVIAADGTVTDFNIHCPMQSQRCKGALCAAYVHFETGDGGFCGMVHRA